MITLLKQHCGHVPQDRDAKKAYNKIFSTQADYGGLELNYPESLVGIALCPVQSTQPNTLSLSSPTQSLLLTYKTTTTYNTSLLAHSAEMQNAPQDASRSAATENTFCTKISQQVGEH